MQLRYPYPRAVSEPALYHDAVEISNLSLAEAESLMSMKQASKAVKASKTSNNDLDLSVGGIIRNTELLILITRANNSSLSA